MENVKSGCVVKKQGQSSRERRRGAAKEVPLSVVW